MTGFIGLGTIVNVLAILAGSLVGMGVGHRLPDRVREVVTDALGLVTVVIALQSAWAVSDPALEAAVGAGVPVLVVLGAVVAGGIVGAALRLEDRLEDLAGHVQRRLARPGEGDEARERFVEGFLTASLLFCIGPLAVLGSLSDGLGLGIEQLVLKSTLDLFASMAFGATFGVGVLASAGSVAVVQGSLTLLGVALGSIVPEAHIAALTATGGVLLLGIALRLLQIRQVPVADLLPALLLAPALVTLAARLG